MRTRHISDEQYLEAITSVMSNLPISVYAFSGAVEVPVELRVAGHTVRHVLRLEYQCTPGREYFDPRLRRVIEGRDAATLKILVSDQEEGWMDVPPSLFMLSGESSDLNEHLWSLGEADAARQEHEARLAHGKQDN